VLRFRHPDWVALQTRQSGLEGTGAIRLRDLVKESLRTDRDPGPLRHRVTRLEPLLAAAARALRSDEPQHVSRDDLTRRLAHHTEKHPQIRRSRQHRVRPTPSL